MVSERLRARLKALLTFKDTPHRLGLAFGLGVMLGILPGTGALAAAACATFFRLNLPLAVAGTFLMNPFTMVFVYGGSYALGRWLLGETAAVPWLGARIVLRTLVGNVLLAVGFGVVGYLVVVGLVTAGRWRTRSRSPKE